MLICTRRIEFDAAHRVMEHESKCRNLHGHRYVMEAGFTASGLDHVGRIIDFSIIKTLLGDWIDTHWDHTTILYDMDKSLGEAISHQTGQRIFYLNKNPTAENMADYLLHTVCPELFREREVTCVRIKLYETPNCYVEASL